MEKWAIRLSRLARMALMAAPMLLAGCQSMAPLNFSTPNVGYSSTKLDAELRSLTVSLARPDEAKGEIPAGTEAIPQLWQSALQEALDRMAIFKDDGSKKINVSVKILALDAPAFGASMTTTTIARYELIDRANGDIIYSQEISAAGEVPFGYSLVGLVRARESVNRSVQNNISQFLQALETVDISKPMFPTQAQASVK